MAYNCAKAGSRLSHARWRWKEAGNPCQCRAPDLVDTASNIAAMKPKDLKRWAKREDVAETVLFLASQASVGITWQVIAVTGAGL
jgi:NAD(P)-dependent dehydrogenase (short-subunit alcohol dehydrogenase family)